MSFEGPGFLFCRKKKHLFLAKRILYPSEYCKTVILATPARGSSDKNFRLCPSTDGRPYLLGFEKFLTGVTGRGGKEDGLLASLRLRSHVSAHTTRSTKKKQMNLFGTARGVGGHM